eukprot:176311-Chlamydomonas_euryale.AAC.1
MLSLPRQGGGGGAVARALRHMSHVCRRVLRMFHTQDLALREKLHLMDARIGGLAAAGKHAGEHADAARAAGTASGGPEHGGGAHDGDGGGTTARLTALEDAIAVRCE